MKNKKNPVDEINEAIGKDIAFYGADIKEKQIKALPTGILPLDWAIGIGGLPEGRIIEIHGKESSGKSSICLAIIAQYQRQGLRCAYVDAEYTFSFELAEKFGVNTDELLLIKSDYGEEAFDAIEKLVRGKMIDFIVVDSISALVPKSVLEADTEKTHIGPHAKMVTKGVSRLVSALEKSSCTIVFINQLRMNIMGGQYDQWIVTGGQALKHYSSLMIEVHRDKAIMLGEKLIGYGMRIKIKKNKVGVPGEECLVKLLFNKGFSAEADILEYGQKAGIILREGNTYFFGEEKMGIGENKARTWLEQNPGTAEKILQLLQQQSPALETPQQETRHSQ